MSKRAALFLAIALGAIGCTTTKGPQGYQSDQPPPIEGRPRAQANPDTPPALPKNQLSADSIDESNYRDSVKKLEAEMRSERGAMSKAEK